MSKNLNEYFVVLTKFTSFIYRYTIREQVLDDGMVSELGISHTYRQDTGMYICQARYTSLPLYIYLLILPLSSSSNAFGQDEMSMHLIVQEVPEQPKNLRINAQQSRSLQLTWSQPFAGNSPIEEYHVQHKVISGKCYCCHVTEYGKYFNLLTFLDNWQTAERISVTGSQTVVNIINLHPAKAYHIRMAAENKLGSSEFSEVVQITTLEEGNFSNIPSPLTCIKTMQMFFSRMFANRTS